MAISGISALIPGVNALYSILKRDIERENDVLKQRHNLATILRDNCRTWSSLLTETFLRAAGKWEGPNGQALAQQEIVDLQNDFLKLDYYSLRDSSPILRFLREDGRFAPFAEACARFYTSALDVKRMVYGQICNASGHEIRAYESPIREMVLLWNAEVERMLEDVTVRFHETLTITPS